jgi:hypothetical protein
VLAAIIANLQNVVQPSLVVYVDNGGGGAGVGGPEYVIGDYLAAYEAFPEIPGEHPVARAVRRNEHVQKWLPIAKTVRERREGAAFMAGAQLSELERDERDRATMAEMAALYDSIHGDSPNPTAKLFKPPAAGALVREPMRPIARAIVGVGAIAAAVLLVDRLRHG